MLLLAARIATGSHMLIILNVLRRFDVFLCLDICCPCHCLSIDLVSEKVLTGIDCQWDGFFTSAIDIIWNEPPGSCGLDRGLALRLWSESLQGICYFLIIVVIVPSVSLIVYHLCRMPLLGEVVCIFVSNNLTMLLLLLIEIFAVYDTVVILVINFQSESYFALPRVLNFSYISFETVSWLESIRDTVHVKVLHFDVCVGPVFINHLIRAISFFKIYATLHILN